MMCLAAFENVPLSIATYAVATAVSLLPASLIAVVALSLANASKELANRNALVRKSDAIETLAAVTVCHSAIWSRFVLTDYIGCLL